MDYMTQPSTSTTKAHFVTGKECSNIPREKAEMVTGFNETQPIDKTSKVPTVYLCVCARAHKGRGFDKFI